HLIDRQPSGNREPTSVDTAEAARLSLANQPDLEGKADLLTELLREAWDGDGGTGEDDAVDRFRTGLHDVEVERVADLVADATDPLGENAARLEDDLAVTLDVINRVVQSDVPEPT